MPFLPHLILEIIPIPPWPFIIGQHLGHINNRKPPFVIVSCLRSPILQSTPVYDFHLMSRPGGYVQSVPTLAPVYSFLVSCFNPRPADAKNRALMFPLFSRLSLGSMGLRLFGPGRGCQKQRDE